MSTAPVPDFQIETAAQLAEYLAQAATWSEIEKLTAAFSHLKIEAWGLLKEDQQQHILELKKFKDFEMARLYPLGCTVQRKNDPEKKQGEVTGYWQAYGVEYVAFSVNGFADWCQGSRIKRIYTTQ